MESFANTTLLCALPDGLFFVLPVDKLPLSSDFQAEL
jgi:hypothetical protein